MGIDDVQAVPPRLKLAPPTAFSHYYGDRVRQLFLVGGVIMLIGIPFFNDYLPVPAIISLSAALLVVIVAGLTNPLQRWVMFIDVPVSLIAALSFEYHAISRIGDIPWLLFGIDQILALLFFFALYFSTKTLRGILVSDYTVNQRKQEQREKEEMHRYRH